MAVKRGPNGADRRTERPGVGKGPGPDVTAAQQEIETARRELEHVFALLQHRVAREAELERTIAALRDERQELLVEAQRIRTSRAWRYGHGAMRAVGRVTRRAVGDDGAVDLMIARLSRPDETLSPSGETDPEVRGRVPARRGQQARH